MPYPLNLSNHLSCGATKPCNAALVDHPKLSEAVEHFKPVDSSKPVEPPTSVELSKPSETQVARACYSPNTPMDPFDLDQNPYLDELRTTAAHTLYLLSSGCEEGSRDDVGGDFKINIILFVVSPLLTSISMIDRYHAHQVVPDDYWIAFADVSRTKAIESVARHRLSLISRIADTSGQLFDCFFTIVNGVSQYIGKLPLSDFATYRQTDYDLHVATYLALSPFIIDNLE